MYERPGRSFYTVATKAVMHLAPVTELGIVGAAIKNTAKKWSDGLDANYARIEVGEKINIRTKGIHEFSTAVGSPGVALAGAAKGTAVYIKPADNTLTIEPGAAVGDLPFGRIVEIPADNRGVAANKVRIDLDQKDTIVPAV